MWWTIIISVLLQFLPKILEWLKELFSSGKKLSEIQVARINKVIWYCNEIREAGVKVGAKAEGTPPEYGGDLSEGFITDWIIAYVLKHLPEIALPVLKEAIIPALRRKAEETATAWDDYALKQAERIANDPEFIALLGGLTR